MNSTKKPTLNLTTAKHEDMSALSIGGGSQSSNGGATGLLSHRRSQVKSTAGAGSVLGGATGYAQGAGFHQAAANLQKNRFSLKQGHKK
jgi:hypothetical protein